MIQAQQMAKVAKPKPISPAVKWPSAKRCASCDAARLKAMTKVRSNRSSSVVAVL
ncbi:hypothetical protein D9M72_638930 [compost metagenome]